MTDSSLLADSIHQTAESLAATSRDLDTLAQQVSGLSVVTHGGGDPMTLLAVFVLACFVGYYVIWRVTPALHAPLMAVTNAISSVIIVGALIPLTERADMGSVVLGYLGLFLVAINIFGGFMVTERMLAMFKKKSA